MAVSTLPLPRKLSELTNERTKNESFRLTLRFVDFHFGPGFHFLERLQALAIARFVLVLGVVEILDTLFGIVIVTSPTSQIAVVIRRWRWWRWWWRRVGLLLVVGRSSEERIAILGFSRATTTELGVHVGKICLTKKSNETLHLQNKIQKTTSKINSHEIMTTANVINFAFIIKWLTGGK